MRNLELLTSLYSIHSKSGNEKKMRSFIKKWVKANVPDAIATQDKAGNLYVTRGTAENYPCICSHMDQVQDFHSKDFQILNSDDMICAYSPKTRSFQGLGADDKNGIWVALTCLQKYDIMKCAFFVGEEVGCVGSSQADMAFFDDCRYCLQVDRKGHSDLITDISSQLCSDEFLADVKCEEWGYEETHGLMTDVDTLRNNGLAISCVNMSCGYYEPHTDHEYVVKSDMMKCLRFVEHIIEDCQKVYPYEYVPSCWFGGRFGGRKRHLTSVYDDQFCEAMDACIEEVYAGNIIDEGSFEMWWKDAREGYNLLTREDKMDFWDEVQYHLPEADYYLGHEDDNNIVFPAN